MKKILLFLSLFLVAANAEAKITIFACEPQWASVAQEIAGDKADIFIAVPAQQDPHSIKVTQSLIKMMSKADMIFCTGGDLEESWLPSLAKHQPNQQVKLGESGNFMALDYVKKIEITNAIMPAGKAKTKKEQEKEVKPRISTAIHLNPHNITIIAAEFARRIQLIDPLNANFYERSHEAFAKKWKKSIEVWEKKSKALQGKKIVAHAGSFEYLAEWLGMKYVDKIDLQTVDITSDSYMRKLAKKLKKDPADMIIFAPFENRKVVFWLNEKTKIKAVLLPFTIRGTEEVKDLFNLFENTINRLQLDCSKVVCKAIPDPATQDQAK